MARAKFLKITEILEVGLSFEKLRGETKPKLPNEPPSQQERVPSPIMARKRLGRRDNLDKDKRDKELEEKAAEEIEEKPVELTIWQKLEQLWTSTSDKAEQRTEVGNLFELTDGPPASINAITLDLAFSHLLFAHESGLNTRQTEVFWDIMGEIQDMIASPTKEHTTREVYDLFKRLVISNSTTAHADPTNPYNPANLQPLESQKKSTPVPVEPEAENETEKDDNVKEREISKSNKRRSVFSSKDRIKDDDDDDSENTDAVEEEPVPEVSALFTSVNVKQITDYMMGTLFSHFTLYQCVLNARLFQPRVDVTVQPIQLETVIPDEFTLDAAEAKAPLVPANVSARGVVEEEKKTDASALANTRSFPASASVSASVSASPSAEPAVAPAAGIAGMVQMHMEKAKLDMEEMLRKNEDMLNAKFKALEAKLAPSGKKKK